MNPVLALANAAAVGLFGTILSASFCDIRWDRKKKSVLIAAILAMGMAQGVLYAVTAPGTVQKLYPLITHLPLVLVLWGLKQSPVWSTIAVLTAYLCCQLRRWVALFCVALLSGNAAMQAVVEIIVTLPLLLLLLRCASPTMRVVSHYSVMIQVQFGLLPAIGYAFDYITRIYTNWLMDGVVAVVEFMPFLCSAAYLFFSTRAAETQQRQSELQQQRLVLDLQIKQSAQQIEDMRKSQELAAAYRHDLHHHLQYLSACMENNELEQARTYMKDLDDRITRQAVASYCGNTAANLILSSFVGRAAEAGVPMSVQLRLGNIPRVSNTDLCVLLSNALENALNACVAQKQTGKDASIEVRGYEKHDRVFLEIVNSCGGEVVFENGLPVTRKPGHGIGVRSICTITEKYSGLYDFEVRDGRFMLRLSL